MMHELLYLHGNFKEMVRYIGLPDAFYQPAEDPKGTIEKDLYRQPFISRRYTVADFIRHWRQSDTSNAYVQGNAMGACLTVYALTTRLLNSMSTQPTTALDTLLQQIKHLSFAFVDDEGRDCGFSIAYLEKVPNFFAIAEIKKTRAAPDQRKVQFWFARTRNMLPVDLELDNETAATRMPHSKLKHSLLNIEALPAEVKQLIDVCITEEGALNMPQIDKKQALLKAHTNIDGWTQQKVDQFKQLFIALQQQLETHYIDNPNTRNSSTYQRILENIKKNIELSNEIFELKLDLEDKAGRQFQTECLKLKTNLLRLLRAPLLNQPYKEVNDALTKQFPNINQLTSTSFVKRRQSSIVIATIATLAAVATAISLVSGLLPALTLSFLVLSPLVITLAAICVSLTNWLYVGLKGLSEKKTIVSYHRCQREYLEERGLSPALYEQYKRNPSLLASPILSTSSTDTASPTNSDTPPCSTDPNHVFSEEPLAPEQECASPLLIR